MNPRRQAIFLWEWSRRRALGRGKVVLLGAGIGALGGIGFGALLLAATAGSELRLNEDEIAPFVLPFARALGPAGFLFALAAPAFAFLGALGADRLWAMQEFQYRAFIEAGARVPETAPEITWADRAPKWIVVAVALLVVAGLLFGLWWEMQRGTV